MTTILDIHTIAIETTVMIMTIIVVLQCAWMTINMNDPYLIPHIDKPLSHQVHRYVQIQSKFR